MDSAFQGATDAGGWSVTLTVPAGTAPGNLLVEGVGGLLVPIAPAYAVRDLNPAMSGLIDFYFACNDLFAYDVAVCLNAWCFEEPNAINVTKARALLRDPQLINRLSQQVAVEGCIHCNRCMPTIYEPGGTRCVLNSP